MHAIKWLTFQELIILLFSTKGFHLIGAHSQWDIRWLIVSNCCLFFSALILLGFLWNSWMGPISLWLHSQKISNRKWDHWINVRKSIVIILMKFNWNWATWFNFQTNWTFSSNKFHQFIANNNFSRFTVFVICPDLLTIYWTFIISF